MAKLFLPFKDGQGKILDLEGRKKTITLPQWAIDYLKADPHAENPKHFMKSSWAYRCVMIRANALAAVEWEIQQPDGTAVPQHEIDTLLREINKDANWHDMIRALEADLNIYAHAYLLKIGKGKTPKFLKRLNPYTMKRMYDAKVGLVGFEQWIDGKKFADFSRKEIIYFHFYHPTEDFGGLSPTHMAKGAIDAESNAEKYVSAFFANYALPAAILETDAYIDQGEAEGIVAKFRRKFLGADKQHKIALLDRGTKVKELGWPLKELALAEVRNEARRTICAAYGVPPILVGAWEAANYATADAAKKSLYTETMIPQGDYISGVLNAELVPHFGENIKHVFRYDRLPAMQEDEGKRAQRYALLVEKRVITAAAAAERLGFTPEETGTGPVVFQPGAFPTQETEKPVEKRTALQLDLDKWCRKALKRVKEGKPANVKFESEHIPLALGEAIAGSLETAETQKEVRAVFSSAFDYEHFPHAQRKVGVTLKQVEDTLKSHLTVSQPGINQDINLNIDGESIKEYTREAIEQATEKALDKAVAQATKQAIEQALVKIDLLKESTEEDMSAVAKVLNELADKINKQDSEMAKAIKELAKSAKSTKQVPAINVNVEPTPIINQIDLPSKITERQKVIRNKRTGLIDSVEGETTLQ